MKPSKKQMPNIKLECAGSRPNWVIGPPERPLTFTSCSLDIHTFFSLVGNFAKIKEVRSYDVVVDAVVIPELYPQASAEWREHLGEYNLLVPDRLVGTLLYGCSALNHSIFELVLIT